MIYLTYFIFHIYRYIVKRLIPGTKCEVYISGIKNLNNSAVGREADLVQAKSRGYLTHSDHNLYIILKQLEICFSKHANSNNVLEDTYNEFFKINIGLKCTCVEHRLEMLTNIFSYYIIMRMRQYTYMVNQNMKKQNNTKKKLSKLVLS